MSNIGAYDLMDALAKRIEAEWAGERKATVAVAEDPAHALDLLTAGRAGGCAVVLFYLSDAPDGDEFSEDTRLDAQIRVGIVQDPGLKLRNGKTAPTVLQLIDAFRKWMAAESFEGLLDGGLGYKGMTHIPAAQGRALHGYAMTYGAVYAYETQEA